MNKINKKTTPVYLLFALIFGAVCGVFRGGQLQTAFEPLTGLLEPGDGNTLLLHVCCAVAVALFIGIAFFFARSKSTGEALSKSGERALSKSTERALCFAAGFALILAAGVELVTGGSPAMSRVIFLAFSAFAAVGMIVSARFSPGGDKFASDMSFFRVVPVFWCCFWLVLLYRDNSSTPNVEQYAYTLIAVAFSVMMFYYTAGGQFGAYRPGPALFCVLGTVFFGALAVTGDLVAMLRYRLDPGFVGAAFYLIPCLLFALGAGVGLEAPEEPEIAEGEEQAEQG